MTNCKPSCSCCGLDLSESSNSVDYRIVLDSEAVPSCGGAVTDMHIDPEISEKAYFCNTVCLFNWLKLRLGDRIAL